MRIRTMTMRDFTQYGKEIEGWANDVGEASSGEFTSEELMQAIEKRSHHPWAWTTDDHELKGMFVTTIVKYVRGNTLCIVGAAGECMDSWDAFSSLVNELAKQLNCVDMEMRGRKGLAKKFKSVGWEQPYVVLRRPVLAIPGSYLKASGE
jgi:hypothetical protein